LQRVRRRVRSVGPYHDADGSAIREARTDDVAARDIEPARDPVVEDLPRRDGHGDLRDAQCTALRASRCRTCSPSRRRIGRMGRTRGRFDAGQALESGKLTGELNRNMNIKRQAVQNKMLR
jgi:hypothetical protein